MPFLHLPVQSGSDRVLKAMNRSHSTRQLSRHHRARFGRRGPTSRFPAISSSVSPAKPTREFEDTLEIVRAVNYAQAYSFKYSARPGTPAAADGRPGAAPMMDERLQRLQALLNQQQLAFNHASVGQVTEVLIERHGRKAGQMIGKSPWLQSVHLETAAAIGDLVEVEIVSAGPNSLAGAERMAAPLVRRIDTGRTGRLMAQKKAEMPTPRARLEIEFAEPHLLGPLFGEFDRNLVAIEDRLGVYIAARGSRVQIEGEPEAAARARDVLQGLYNRLDEGHDVDQGAVEAVIAMSGQPTLEGIISNDVAEPPKVMIRTRKKTIVPRSKTQVAYMEALARDDLIFALGPAGTGKTYLAVAQAVQQLIGGSVDRLILSRPAVEAGERLGFLPGDMKEKVDPYLRPLYDALYDMLPTEQVERRIASGEIEIAPIAFMRGRTLADAFIILDEAQNTTPQQMKMFLTRFGMRSRMVVCGDPLAGRSAQSGNVRARRRGRQARGHRQDRDHPLRPRRRRPPSAGRQDRRSL